MLLFSSLREKLIYFSSPSLQLRGPLLLGNPRAQWQALSDNRRPIYEKLADDAIKVDDMNVGQIVDEIKKNLP